MINLIPQAAKANLRKEYIVRALSVWALLISLALFASGVLLLPTYVLYTKQIHTATAASESLKEKDASFKTIESTLTEANAFATQLSKSLDSVKASDILTHIEDALPSEVVLEGLNVVQEKNTLRIEARGTARTREALRHFTDALKRDAFFADAQVPISDLAQDTNLSFTVSLTLRTSS